MKKVATRFAPSPTGPLHIGGVRTALFNWLYSKNHNGKFFLRIEDTDKERSKEEFKLQILNSLKWIGINHDGEEYIQSKNIESHIKVVNKLLETGNAYKCYCSSDEIEEQKLRAKQKKIPYIYNRKWRDKSDIEAPQDVKPVIRFKSKIEGSTENNTIEDFIILRRDGTPTYNLSASVDDHIMHMTHIIRGDDHKINTFKQIQIYEALQWEKPLFAHIPLIHTLEGKKLSKRDNASTIDDYEKIGIMPDALRNYLMRLGWSYKDKEIFSLEESIKYFNLEGIGKSPSKLDMSRILSMNEYYIKNKSNDDLFQSFEKYCKNFKENINIEKLDIIKKSITFLKNKAKTMEDIYNNSKFIINDEIIIEKAEMSLLTENAKNIIKSFMKKVNEIEVFNKETLEPIINNLISENQTNFKGVGQPLRIVLTGSKFGPGIYDIIISLGKKRVLDRLSKVA